MTLPHKHLDGRFVPVELDGEPRRWRIWDKQASGPVRPHGWSGWTIADEAEAIRVAQELKEGGPLCAVVRRLLADRIGLRVTSGKEAELVERVARFLWQRHDRPADPDAVPGLADEAVLVYQVLEANMWARLPTLTDETEPPPLALTSDFYELLRAGIEWLGTAQPEGATVSHFGISCGPWHTGWGGRIRLGLLVEGGARDRGPTVVVKARTRHALTRAEAETLRAAVDGFAPVVDEWNGEGCGSLSMRIDRTAHPTLVAALELEHKGCQEHDRHDQSCDWLRASRHKLIVPEGWS